MTTEEAKIPRVEQLVQYIVGNNEGHDAIKNYRSFIEDLVRETYKLAVFDGITAIEVFSGVLAKDRD